MSKTAVLIAITVALIVISALLFIAFRIKINPNSHATQETKPHKTDQAITLKTLLDIASNPNSSKDELFNALKIFESDFQIPPKSNDKAPTEAKNYLNFILLLSSHKNVDAKMIAFMNNRLTKKNPQYASEIEFYEEQGRLRRKG